MLRRRKADVTRALKAIVFCRHQCTSSATQVRKFLQIRMKYQCIAGLYVVMGYGCAVQLSRGDEEIMQGSNAPEKICCSSRLNVFPKISFSLFKYQEE